MSKGNDGHRERLRQRMLQEGLQSFHDHEILELLLFQSIPRKDTNKIAHDLIDGFGNLYNVLNATPERLMTVDGVSHITACNLSMLKEVFQRYNQSKIKRQKFTGISQIIEFSRTLISNAYVEQLIIVYVDPSTTYLHHEIYCSNHPEHVDVDIKKIVATTVRVGANAVVIAHCHPNGEIEPSEPDIRFTRNLFFALGSLDILVLDHIIFNGSEQYFSMYDTGIMKQIQSDYRKVLLS